MDDTFGFVAPVMPRRVVHPLALRAAVIAAVFVAVTGALGAFVVSQERAADERRAVLATQVAAQEAAEAAEAAATVSVTADDPVEMAARTSAEDALVRALAIPDLAEAGPAALATGRSPLTFVDGPSTAPSVVSVAATDEAWAAAVMGADGCLWIRLDVSGGISRDRGEVCTGTAALGALATGAW